VCLWGPASGEKPRVRFRISSHDRRIISEVDANDVKASAIAKMLTPPTESTQRFMPFRFLDLPGEIQNLIYGYILVAHFNPFPTVANEVGQAFFQAKLADVGLEKKIIDEAYGNGEEDEDNEDYQQQVAAKSLRTIVPYQAGYFSPWTIWQGREDGDWGLSAAIFSTAAHPQY
jgi:hypothetical protein